MTHTLDDLRNFRQWESKTPGHPEYLDTPGVEATTGPLGQGFGNGANGRERLRLLAESEGAKARIAAENVAPFVSARPSL